VTDRWQVLTGNALDVLRTLPAEHADCVVTSPPYWGLRNYGVSGQIGLEATPDAYLVRMREVFAEVWRVLKRTGTLWVNMGDCYIADRCGTASRETSTLEGAASLGAPIDKEADRRGASWNKGHAASAGVPGPNRRNRLGALKAKDLVGMPWRLAFALQEDGWWLRRDVVWAKPNPMPESILDRCTNSHEYVFHFAKSGRTLLWRHRETRVWVWKRPPAEWRWWDRRELCEVVDEPAAWHEEAFVADSGRRIRRFRRFNLWRGFDYFYDADAIREPYTYNHGLGSHHRNVTGPVESAVPDTRPQTGLHRSSKRVPFGWDTSDGNHHGTEGRYSHQRVDRVPRERKQDESASASSGATQRRMAGMNARYDAAEAAGRYDVRRPPLVEQEWASREAPAFSPDGRNRRSVWTIATQAYRGAHFATFPEQLARLCILAGCPHGGLVLDPFSGSARAGVVALKLGCRYVGIELNPAYVAMSARDLAAVEIPTLLDAKP
jgi:DNA modification methylase